MAKKKKHNRKKSTYKARAKQQAVGTTVPVAATTIGASPVKPQPAPTQAAKKPGDDTHQVVAKRARKEVKHSLILACVILAGLIGLWCLFSFTSIGSQVFRLFDL